MDAATPNPTAVFDEDNAGAGEADVRDETADVMEGALNSNETVRLLVDVVEKTNAKSESSTALGSAASLLAQHLTKMDGRAPLNFHQVCLPPCPVRRGFLPTKCIHRSAHRRCGICLS